MYYIGKSLRVKRILVNGDCRKCGIETLRERDDVALDIVSTDSAHQWAERIRGAHAVLARSAPVTAEMIDSAPGLLIVSKHGVGYDRIDVDALTARGIPLAITATANAQSVAEQTMLLMLACAKRILPSDFRTRHGELHAARKAFDRIELYGKKVLVLGFGRTGKVVVKRCLGFEMDVLVCCPTHDPKGILAAGATPVEDFRSVLGEVDFVTLHVPLTDATRGLIGRDELAAMKPTSILVNCARGGLVDEEALHDALKSCAIFGAGLDVFRQEPPPADHPLFALDNLVVSPHAGGSAAEALERMGEQAARNILDAFDGRLDPAMVVNPQVL